MRNRATSSAEALHHVEWLCIALLWKVFITGIYNTPLTSAYKYNSQYGDNKQQRTETILGAHSQYIHTKGNNFQIKRIKIRLPQFYAYLEQCEDQFLYDK